MLRAAYLRQPRQLVPGGLIALACLVTAVGLTCACAEYFCQRLPLSYRSLVIILAGFSFIVSNLGLDQADPGLDPGAHRDLSAVHRAGGAELLHRPLAFGDAHPRPGDAGFLAFGVLDALKAGLGQDFPQWLLHLPLAEQGLAWLIPSVATRRL